MTLPPPSFYAGKHPIVLSAEDAERGTFLKIIVRPIAQAFSFYSQEWPKADVAVFSPPYKDKDGYRLTLMDEVGTLLQKALKPRALAFMNFGQLKADFRRPFTASERLGQYLLPWQTIIWAKSLALPDETGQLVQRGHYQPLLGDHLLNYCFEYLFTFYKDSGPGILPLFDRLAVGSTYADKTNLNRGTRGKNGDVHCAGDIWWVPYTTTGQTTKKRHAYEFPETLVERCLKVAGVGPGSVVLEPFLGSGSTAAAARRLGVSCVGIEADYPTALGALERWKAIATVS